MEIPRALSTDHPAFPAFMDELGERQLVIMFEGVEQAGRVVAYDLDAQTVTRCAHDADGNIILDSRRDRIVYETLSGAVEVSIRERQ